MDAFVSAPVLSNNTASGFPTEAIIAFDTVDFALGLAGLVANVAAIRALCVSRRHSSASSTAPSFYLLNMCVANVLCLVTWYSEIVLMDTNSILTTDPLKNPNTTTLILIAVDTIGTSAELHFVCLLTFLTYKRCQNVYNAEKGVLSTGSSKLPILFLWLLSSFIAGLYEFQVFYVTNNYSVCHGCYYVLDVLVLYALPLAAIAIMNTMISYRLRNSIRFRVGSIASALQRASFSAQRRRTANMLQIVTSVFGVCYGPYFTLTLVYRFIGDGGNTEEYLHRVTVLLVHLSYLLSPLILFATSKQLRRQATFTKQPAVEALANETQHVLTGRRSDPRNLKAQPNDDLDSYYERRNGKEESDDSCVCFDVPSEMTE